MKPIQVISAFRLAPRGRGAQQRGRRPSGDRGHSTLGIRGPLPDQVFDQSSATWAALSKIITLCNRAEFRPGQDSVPIMKVKPRAAGAPCLSRVVLDVVSPAE